MEFLGFIGSCVVAIFSLIGVIYTANKNSDKTITEIKVSQAVNEERFNMINREIKEMKADIKEHNGYAKVMPVLQEKIEMIEKKFEKS